MESELDLRAYAEVVRRRLLFLVIPAVLVAAMGLAVAYALPPTYEASATILVQSQLIPKDLAAPTVTASADERIQVIEQRLLARENLLAIARKFDLYSRTGVGTSPTQTVDNMRDAISIEQIDAGDAASRRTGQVIGFTVTFGYRDPTIASRVTSELVSSILAQNIETRLSSAAETAKFLEQQKASIAQQLKRVEDSLAEFKRANDADLPETLPARRERLAQLMSQLGEISQRIRLSSLDGASEALASASPVIQQATFELQAKQLQLSALKDDHERLAPLVEEGIVSANRVRDLEQQIALAEIGIQSAEAQIAAQGGTPNNETLLQLLRDQEKELSDGIAALSESIGRTPGVEAALNQLNRDYENLQAEYRLAQARLTNAQTGEQLEQDRQAEQFDVIEQPTIPETPTEPNRPRIMLMAVFAGLASGLGLVVVLEMLDKRLHSPQDLERRLQLHPIATIPYLETAWEERRRKLAVLAWVIVVVGLGIIALAAIDFYYLPLDLLAQRAWQKLAAILPVAVA